eukprot:scaffold119683_cov15-Prasinocladus_malaysianus.AAC.1
MTKVAHFFSIDRGTGRPGGPGRARRAAQTRLAALSLSRMRGLVAPLVAHSKSYTPNGINGME